MPTWVQLADGSWLNLANVNMIRRERTGKLRLEFIGEHGVFVDQHHRISDPRDIALIEAYLLRSRVTGSGRTDHTSERAPIAPPTPTLPKSFPSDGMQG